MPFVGGSQIRASCSHTVTQPRSYALLWKSAEIAPAVHAIEVRELLATTWSMLPYAYERKEPDSILRVLGAGRPVCSEHTILAWAKWRLWPWEVAARARWPAPDCVWLLLWCEGSRVNAELVA